MDKKSDNEVEAVDSKQNFLLSVLYYKPVLYFFFFMAIFLAFTVSKDYIFSILTNNDNNIIVHKDKTSISFKAEGFHEKVNLDREKATKVILTQLNKLETYKEKQTKEFLRELKTILDNEFKNNFDNIKVFADWFYSYTTQYKILYQAGKGIVNNYRAGLSDFKIKDAATNQVNDYISTKYKDLVLKPHLLEPSLKLKLKKLIQAYTDNKDIYVKQINNEFNTYLSQNPQNLSRSVLDEMKVDWQSNIANSRNLVTLKDKSAEGALAIGITSIIGAKIVSSTTTKVMVSKIMAKFGLKKAIASMTAKVATAPFTLGMSLVVGFLIDNALNEIDEIATRDSFIDDVNKNLTNLKDTLYFEIKKQNIIQTIYNQDINLFKNFINGKIIE
jgi:hypothetical protein